MRSMMAAVLWLSVAASTAVCPLPDSEQFDLAADLVPVSLSSPPGCYFCVVLSTLKSSSPCTVQGWHACICSNT